MPIIQSVIISSLNRLKLYGELVMFSHSLFALPFGLMGMLLAANGLPEMRVFFWIIVALVGARNAANALNRLIDARIDAANPRTANRHLPRGLVSGKEVLMISIIGFALFLLASWQLNPLCFKLAPVALFIMVIYSYTKRFTWACHLVLGFACGIAPTASWIAVTGSFALPPMLLSAAVMCWVAGFDIIYGTLDTEFDRKTGIYAIPARFGIPAALNIAKALHLAVILFLLLVPVFSAPPHAVPGLFYYLGIAAVSVLLFWEHLIVKPDDLNRVTTAAYTANQIIGVTLLVFTVLDVFIHI
ncbi:MAG: UbiA-like polyprenyltransferase [Thermacetogeniaceae bacterium]|jgi:4-hydroxybenzoate polyprenyltransferase|nr:UbiA family prenyltransferase [Syntrophomonadaceae bacterium]